MIPTDSDGDTAARRKRILDPLQSLDYSGLGYSLLLVPAFIYSEFV
jgi:hypothetical protein